MPEQGAGICTPGLYAGVNLCVDGSMPFLIGPSVGKTFRPSGYLPQRDFKIADQARIAAPERAWPSNRGSAELYDRKRTEVPAWKPGRFARGATFEPLRKPARSMQQPQARSLPNLVRSPTP